MPLPDPFPVARYRLQYTVRRPIQWPDYEGSALRGLWGHALRHLACATGAPRCEGCPLRGRCAYGCVFEPAPPPGAHRSPSEIAPPYIVEPPLNAPRELHSGDTSHFDVVFFGRALEHLPLLLLAWQRALSRGIGPLDGGAELRQVHALGDAAGEGPGAVVLELWRRAPATLAAHPQAVELAPRLGEESAVAVELLTPLRLKREGKLLSAAPLQAGDFLGALVRRIGAACEMHAGTDTGLDFVALKQAARDVRLEAARLDWRPVRRWSNRQQRHTDLSGLVGSFVLAGPLAPFRPLLYLGQWLHVGGKAAFGLGRYRVRPLSETGSRA